jgi:ribosomal protein L37AE/L43A
MMGLSPGSTAMPADSDAAAAALAAAATQLRQVRWSPSCPSCGRDVLHTAEHIVLCVVCGNVGLSPGSTAMPADSEAAAAALAAAATQLRQVSALVELY